MRQTQKSARKLLELINATLDLGRLERGQELVTVSDVDPSVLLREIKGETSELQQKPGLRFVWKIPPRLPVLRTDAAKLKVVLKNLIDNAVKFTREGCVTMGARVHGEGVEIAVTDTGIGIAPDVLPVIFEPFRQGEDVLTREHGGAGLGLYIVRQLLALLGATVTVESQVGRGSTFQVWLPTPAHGRRARESPETVHAPAENGGGLYATSIAESSDFPRNSRRVKPLQPELPNPDSPPPTPPQARRRN